MPCEMPIVKKLRILVYFKNRSFNNYYLLKKIFHQCVEKLDLIQDCKSSDFKNDSKQCRTFTLLHIHLYSFKSFFKHAAPMRYLLDCWCPKGFCHQPHSKQSFRNATRFDYVESPFRFEPLKIQLIAT